MQNIARNHDGKCLSKEYIDLYAPLEWMCAKGHTWDAPYSIVRQGGWCVQCLKKEQRLEELKEIAEAKGEEMPFNKLYKQHNKIKEMAMQPGMYG